MEAVLVAGGQGKRLGEAARGLPKALVPVAGRPISSYMVERLTAAGISHILVSCAKGQGALFEKSLKRYGNVSAVEEPEPLGRGGGLGFAAKRLRAGSEEPFLVVYGDEMIDVDFGALLELHIESGAALTVTTAPLPTPFGVVEMDEAGKVSSFVEGQTFDDHWVNVGVYAMERALTADLPRQGDAEHELFPRLAEQGKLFAHRHTGVWLTVNTAKDLSRAESYLSTHPKWPNEKRQSALSRDLERALKRARPFHGRRTDRAPSGAETESELEPSHFPALGSR